MTFFRRTLSRLSEDLLLLVLLVALVPLLWMTPEPDWALHRLVDWKTVSALAGLMVLSRGLEVSGYLSVAGQWLLTHVQGERLLAVSLVLFSASPLAFPGKRIVVSNVPLETTRHSRLFWVSLLLYIPFIVLTDMEYAVPAALAVILLYVLYKRHILSGVDWLLLLVFVLMFIDLNLLAGLPAMQQLAEQVLQLPGEVFTAAVLGSQLMSNVPAAIFLQSFTEDWRILAWGVSVGGFGLAIGSLANLIALRLARQPGLWWEFHYWSVPSLIGGCVIFWVYPL